MACAQIHPFPGDLGAKLGATRLALILVAPKMTLSPLEIRVARPGLIPYKMADEKGLFLLVQPSGAKLWRLKYRFHKIERKLSLGQYPEVSLKDARDKRDDARRMLEHGLDPVAERKRAKLVGELRAATTFRAVADEYLEKMEAEGRTPATMKKARWFRDLLDRDIGQLPVADITPQELLAALRKLERRGHRETANRVRSFASRVCRYAIVTARATSNPADVLRGALIAPRTKHHAALLDPKDVGELLRAIDGYTGQPETLLALQGRMERDCNLRSGEGSSDGLQRRATHPGYLSA